MSLSVAQLSTAFPSRRGTTTEAYQSSVERVIAHMKAHLAEPLDLDEIARIASMSKFHFVRIFDETTGTTPHHFLACLRVQRAKDILLKTDKSITEVCMDVGYASLGTFSKTFSSLVGLSPYEFRTMPRRLDAVQFATAVWRYLASKRREKGPQLEGLVQGPSRPRGFTFVGAFDKGVPQGVPYSGTVLLGQGAFSIKRPVSPEFHLMAVLVPFSAKLTEMVTQLPVGLVASLRVEASELPRGTKPVLNLRPLRATDPPIVLALPALPPLMA
jgi:AraC-like DNA-binding protein